MDRIVDDIADSGGIEVIIQNEPGKTAPCCPHGPALLFEKTGNGEEKGRRFYACSACRDRKDCNFFQWEDEKISEARMLAREEQIRSKMPSFTHHEYCSRFREIVTLPLEQRRFCVDCQLLILPGEWENHKKHKGLSEDITVQRLKRPSLLLRPLENKKSNAQYLFADRSCHFLLDMLAELGFQKIVCVGTPRLHELIKLRNMEAKSHTMKSLLLDIDYRYCQFYGQDEFCHYNMFNHHFFNKEAVTFYEEFLSEEGGDKVVMVTDPPFGGLVKPLANSFIRISMTWKKSQNKESSAGELPMIWIFPYFFESRILECFPSFSMLDYQVDYDNHPLYKHGKTGRKQSPVRLFTNLSPKDIILPVDEGYRFCSVCERYVSVGNKHCPKCNTCPSKDGREWRHCDECGRCVKPSWRHCSSCGHCALPDHPCGQSKTGCFNCGSQKHKFRACPKKHNKRMLVEVGRGAPCVLKHAAKKPTAKNNKKKRVR
nr:rRNA N6-adenosine-methyltransferase ZCCHC4 isoform X2 [Misgurnus anguillicaudatus]XP_055032606.1 rRNA N6-adenosine-methyltransferase ZCCHC4 isoform X2 [Misgurnus anguillicaudatus]XP_055032607.1 rRNA N6-adenosine-methyltransferase ZCCHC4 isoform X2 [Misgurnus anguillicaudatus]